MLRAISAFRFPTLDSRFPIPDSRFLAALGVYGVLAYGVERRHREIGVRMALGAGRAQVVRLVAAEAARAVLPGVAVGIVSAILLTRSMRTMLYGIGPGDLTSFVGGAGVPIFAATIACLVPARRASRVDPLTAMRAE